MKQLFVPLASSFVLFACAQSGNSQGFGGASGSQAATSSNATTGAGGGGDCKACITDSDCGGGVCGQFAGDSYCAVDCGQTGTCASGHVCTPVTTAEGQQASLCLPTVGVCASMSSASSSNASVNASASTGSGEVCGALLGPDEKGCCSSCTPSDTCQTNGCYGGWWCNTDTCKCQAPPNPSMCTTSSATTSTGSSGSGGGGVGGSGPSGLGPNGGTIGSFSFAVVGDTRPPTDDDTAGYPTAVITKIWQDVAAINPAFAIATGDYQFAKATGPEGAKQIGLYLTARNAFQNVMYPAMGNHECTGQTDSNCGANGKDGITNNYTSFMQLMLAPIQKTLPYYEIDINDTNGKWTSKFLFVAANAWDSTQSTWLDNAMGKSTTYTFVVRHEGSIATTAPGVTPSENIMAKHPYTMLIAGHTHTFEYFSSERQMIVGNGGAPLAGSVDYGYVIAARESSGAIQFKEYDYSTNAVQQTFAVNPDGTPAP